ncbi:RNA polymerase sigma factor SigJ [Paenibacillus macerans]|uniref:RNA polymerase sigma factor SigJ n=1 Tax=Paenibacillus macerans TaxID=44252 RepID=UPI003D30F3DA
MPPSLLEQYYQEHRNLLTALSYRLTGSWSDAEDIVQEIFVDLQQNAKEDEIRYPKSYFMRAVANRSLNALKSPRHSRELYTGSWLPEPVFEPSPETQLDTLLKEEQVSYAFMVMLERLTPDERAVFVLRESFALEYADIAEIIGKSEVACRKLLSRARKKVNTEMPSQQPSEAVVAKWVSVFIKASRTGEFSPLLELLREDAVMLSDGGGKVKAAINPIVSKVRIVAFWQGIAAKGSLLGELVPIRINGEIGLVHYRDGIALRIILFEGDSQGRIRRIYFIANPDKIEKAPPQ